jgi:quinol monooxygenase YgiN
MAFTQTVTVQAESAESLANLLRDWHQEQAGVAPGYQRARVLADRDRPGRFVIEVELASEEEAAKNNSRPETDQWAKKLQKVARTEPEYHNYDVTFTTT